MKTFVRTVFVLFFSFVLTLSAVRLLYAEDASPSAATPSPTPAQSQDDSKLQDLQNEISDLQNKLEGLRGQEKTLKSQIAVMDNQIKLTQLRMSATVAQINDLILDIDTTTKKINNLEKSLDQLTKILLNRIAVTYEVGMGGSSGLQVMLSSNSVTDFFTRSTYLKIAQAHDKKLVFETQQAKTDYANQKEIFEGKKRKVEALKQELESYQKQLDQEKNAKQALLIATKNDEGRYQDLLAKARAEYAAIQGIIAGGGTEEEIGPVSEGQRIASVIAGPSCNSSGGHVHFIVQKNGGTENPFSYLRGGIDFDNCSGSQCGSSDGDSFSPSGSWNWPIDPKIRMNQGYGSTWAVRNSWVGQIYSFHNGIDIIGSSYDVKAVRAGTLFKGSYSGACRLPYVRVKHNDEGIDTLYLHVIYIQ